MTTPENQKFGKSIQRSKNWKKVPRGRKKSWQKKEPEQQRIIKKRSMEKIKKNMKNWSRIYWSFWNLLLEVLGFIIRFSILVHSILDLSMFINTITQKMKKKSQEQQKFNKKAEKWGDEDGGEFSEPQPERWVFTYCLSRLVFSIPSKMLVHQKDTLCAFTTWPEIWRTSQR